MNNVKLLLTKSKNILSFFTMRESRENESLSFEEIDLMQRSNKKVKHRYDNDSSMDMDEVPLTHVFPTVEQLTLVNGRRREGISYSNAIGGNGVVHPMEEENGEYLFDEISDDEIIDGSEMKDPLCPVIALSKEKRRKLRKPWLNALVVKLFDKIMRYEELIKKLSLKWSLKGDISLTDVGCAYYVVRFTNSDDYSFVLTKGPWVIVDSYLTIRKWIPNFVPDEEPIKVLTAWVRIPNLSVEYFDTKFLLKIGEKIGKVIKIDTHTESMSRG